MLWSYTITLWYNTKIDPLVHTKHRYHSSVWEVAVLCSLIPLPPSLSTSCSVLFYYFFKIKLFRVSCKGVTVKMQYGKLLSLLPGFPVTNPSAEFWKLHRAQYTLIHRDEFWKLLSVHSMLSTQILGSSVIFVLHRAQYTFNTNIRFPVTNPKGRITKISMQY